MLVLIYLALIQATRTIGIPLMPFIFVLLFMLVIYFILSSITVNILISTVGLLNKDEVQSKEELKEKARAEFRSQFFNATSISFFLQFIIFFYAAFQDFTDYETLLAMCGGLVAIYGIFFLKGYSKISDSLQSIRDHRRNNFKECPNCHHKMFIRHLECEQCSHNFEEILEPTERGSIIGSERQRLMKQHGIKWSVFKGRFTLGSITFETFEEAYDYAKKD